MAMVRQLTEGELINRSTPEDDSPSEPMECFNSRPSSRNSSSGSKRNSPAFMPSLQYSKDDLMKYSTIPLSKNWPACLDPAYNNSTGKWDPERWFMNHRSDRILPLDEPRSKRDRPDDGIISHKRKSSDPKERIKEEKDDIVLSPQRRSFGTGCHVIQQSSLARRPGSPSDGRESENFREPSRRIGSGRIMTRDRDQRDWDRDREYGYGNRTDRRDRFDQDDDKDLRRYSNRYNQRDRRSRGGGRDRIDEIEPEWFSSGPTSQSETIELVGFEDPQHEGENRKGKKKRSKQNSRRSSLKLEEGEKVDNVPEDKNLQKKADSKQENSKKPITEVKETNDTPDTNQPTKTGFEFDELFKMEWIPGLISNEPPPESNSNEMGCSRFSQWFRKDSPLHDAVAESRNDSRRSSLHDELIVNVLNSIVEPQIAIPSPIQSSSDNFFAPISPALSPGYALSQTKSSKDIMEMLQSAQASQDSTMNGGPPKESVKTVKELEADLKRIVLGDKPKEEKSAFDKLLQHMSDSNNSQSAPMSMGPLDKSKALQEQDLLQDMLSAPQRPLHSPVQHTFQMFEEKQPIFKIGSGMPSSPFSQPSQNSQNDAFAQLMQQKQHEQHIQQMQQLQLQNHLQQSQNTGGFTVDMLAKLLSSQSPISPASPGQSLNRNDPQMLNSVIQFQRQRELLSSMLKQQQQQQQHQVHNLNQSNVLQPMQQRRCPSAKDIPIQQTLALPTLGISPRQSPLPTEVIGSAIQNQGRIPSPLVFGQQPPALSHAPAPIHPAALVQAMAQNSVNSNTLQVQNPALQRVPSPQELAVHTQSILQNALIKRKLEEQKENFRKRQEAQRGSSPVSSNKNGMAASPLKGLSPTIAFTPTSVMRKIQSEKTEIKEQKGGQQQNGNKFSGFNDIRMSEASQIHQKINPMVNMGISTSESNFNSGANSQFNTQNMSGVHQAPRAVHGQSMSQQRSIHGVMNSVGVPSQGRPIVKVGMSQPLNSDLSRTGISSKTVPHNKPFLPGSNQAHNVHDVDPSFDSIGKYSWQSQMARQQQPNVAAMPQQLQMAATYAALNRAPPNLNPHHPSLIRPVNIASAGNVPSSNINYPLFRNSVQNPMRAQNSSINQLSHLGQVAALQMQRGAIDSRQLQALAQSQRLHPAALQHLLMNSQNQVTAAQAQVVGGFPGNRDTKHLLPGQPTTSRQSPVNLAKWFGNDVLKQKMPEMPPASHQKALLVEEVERQQQQSTVVHN